jgi:hypothetical protein
MALITSTAPLTVPLLGGRDTVVADQGSMYVGISPTPGTGLAGNAAGVATFVETTPYVVFYNSGLLNIYPTHLRLHTTVIGVGNTTGAQNWTFTLDVGNRWTSGGTVLTVNNVNMNSNAKSAAVINVGGTLIATAATGSRRLVGQQAVKFNLETVHDCHQFNFGGPEQADPTSLINNATGAATALSHTTVNFAPIVIGPNQSWLIYRWVAANTQMPAYEVEFGFIEK